MIHIRLFQSLILFALLLFNIQCSVFNASTVADQLVTVSGSVNRASLLNNSQLNNIILREDVILREELLELQGLTVDDSIVESGVILRNEISDDLSPSQLVSSIALTVKAIYSSTNDDDSKTQSTSNTVYADVDAKDNYQFTVLSGNTIRQLTVINGIYQGVDGELITNIQSIDDLAGLLIGDASNSISLSEISLASEVDDITTINDASEEETGSDTESGSTSLSPPKISAGETHICFLHENELICLGDNQRGQLGNSSLENISYQSDPTSKIGCIEINGTQGECRSVFQVDVGHLHSCAVLSSGEFACWGDNTSGQLGKEGVSSSSVPIEGKLVEEDGKNAITMIATGKNHTCILSIDGRVLCWGDNSLGQLGRGTKEAGPFYLPDSVFDPESAEIPEFVFVDFPENAGAIVYITAGDHHTCAIDEGEDIYCWGDNDVGQLGTASESNIVGDEESELGEAFDKILRNSSESAVIQSLSLGVDNSCIIIDGQLRCWGGNEFFKSAPGDSDQEIRNTETLDDLSAINFSGAVPINVYSKFNHTCAIFAGDSIACWGDNAASQISDSTDSPIGDVHDDLTDVYSFSEVINYRFVVTGEQFTCVMNENGSAVQCQGFIIDGERIE